MCYFDACFEVTLFWWLLVVWVIVVLFSAFCLPYGIDSYFYCFALVVVGLNCLVCG